MLPAAHRLRRGSDFGRVLRGPRSTRSGGRLLVVHAAAPDESQDDGVTRPLTPGAEAPDTCPIAARVGFVVSKAVGNAVVRNRTKRRLRAVAGAHLDLLQPGRDVVVRANPAAAHAAYGELDTAYVRQLGRALQPGGVRR